MTSSLLAGAAYFLIVFVIAFGLGALRVTFVAPAVGPFWATLIELPIMLTASWLVCRLLVRRMGIGVMWQAIAMGLCAFALLMVAETGFSVMVFGGSPEEVLASYGTPHGLLGLAGQVAFGVLPVGQHFLRSRPA